MTRHSPAPHRAFASSGPTDQVFDAGSYTSTDEVQISGRKSFFHFSVTSELPPAMRFTPENIKLIKMSRMNFNKFGNILSGKALLHAQTRCYTYYHSALDIYAAIRVATFQSASNSLTFPNTSSYIYDILCS